MTRTLGAFASGVLFTVLMLAMLVLTTACGDSNPLSPSPAGDNLNRVCTPTTAVCNPPEQGARPPFTNNPN